MADRLARFSFVGIILFTSTGFFYWISGGDLKIVEQHLTNEKSPVGLLLSALITSPILGLIMSTIMHYMLNNRTRRHFFHFEDDELKKLYISRLSSIFPSLSESLAKIQDTEPPHHDVNTVWLHHDLLFRELANAEEIRYSTRRMDFFWANIVAVSSIALGCFVGFLIVVGKNGPFVCDLVKAICVVPVAIYMVAGIQMAKLNIKEAQIYEKRFLVHFGGLRNPK